MQGRRHASTTFRLVAALAAALAVVQAAGAHGPVGGGVGYVSSISGLQPPVLGALVTVLGGDDRLQLVNYTGKTIVVDGYEGEPFLRFAPDGVYENTRSPATFLSTQRDPKLAHVPATADAKAAPVWRKVSEGSTFAWHDHRIHWDGKELPPIIQQAPHETHLIFRWSVPAHVGAKAFAITGFLGYRPPADLHASGTSTRPLVIAGAAMLALGAITGCALLVGARRTRRRAP